MKEIFRDIKDYENIYQISNFGNVKSLKRKVKNCNQTGFTGSYKITKEKVLKPKVDRKGYLYVELHKDGKSKSFKIHRLVAEAFIPNPKNKQQVNHINGKKTDNKIENLEWCTNKENQNHAWQKGLQRPRFGKRNPKAKKVFQYDLQGNLIKEWECTMDIERELNISHTSVSLCCRNKVKNIKGYIWKYADVI